MIKQLTYIIAIAGLLFLAAGCKKEKTTVPPTFVHFDFISSGDYYITQDGKSAFNIPVGLTAAADADRTIQFTITSPSGAAEGQQYTLARKSITIPAGKVTDSLVVKGLYNGYPVGRVDTLIVKITGGDIDPIATSNEFTVYLQRYCDVDMANFSGQYTAQDYVDGAPDGGPYPVDITPGSSTGPSSGTLSFDGLFGIPLPFTINIDWSDPSNFTTEVPTQPWFVHPTYGQTTLRPNGKGSFSSCKNSFRIEYELTVAAGSFGKTTTVFTK
jgi:hypothetical protein